jgi:cysteine desulfurase
VSESKRDNARVETAIKLDKKDFADIPPPSMGAPSNVKVSPMAGMSPPSVSPTFSN